MEEVVEALVGEVSGMSEIEVRARAAEEREKFDGLLTEVSSVYHVARQEGVQLNRVLGKDPIDEEFPLDVENILPEMYDLEIEVTVERVHDTNDFGDGKVRNILVSDETGKTQITLWDEDVTKADNVEEGQTIQVLGAYSKQSDYVEDRYGCKAEIHMGSNSFIRDAETGDILIDTRDDDD